MAPLNRASQHGTPSASYAFDPEGSRNEFDHDNISLDSEGRNDGDDETSEEGEDPFQPGHDDSEHAPSNFYSSTAQKMLEPLQQTAERVSRQVEEFARSLDKFNATRDASDQDLWEEAWALLDNYNAVSLSRKQRIAPSSPRPRSSSRNRQSTSDAEAEMRKVQFEADIWALTHDILVCNSPQTVADAQSNQIGRLKELHRYSTNSELWEAFLDSDHSAQEYEAILGWLQNRASTTSPPVDEVISDLMVKSERGQGIWSSGPIYTKSAVKGQKRARSWSTPLDPSGPGLKTTHIRATDDRPLVAQLDPDAQTREQAVLQPQDDFYEQGAWQACWEYLRRGATQPELQEYWAVRKESWRAMTFRLNDPFITAEKPLLSPFLRIMNLASNTDWMDACKVLCQDTESTYKYQSAVLGLLCGDSNASNRVCETIDDRLFSFFNAMLISRFVSYLDSYRHKLEEPSAIWYEPSRPVSDHIQQYLAHSQTDDRTKDESHMPHKSIEAAVICKNFDAFFIQQGQAAAQAAHASGQSAHLMEADELSPRNEVALAAAQDPDSMRMIVHLQLLMKALGYLQESYSQHLYEVENNIANYIGWLQREGKLAMIPLYASKLSEDRIPYVLGAILIDITDPKDRDLQVRLMKQYKISVSDALYGLFSISNLTDIARFKRGRLEFLAPRITEYAGTGKVRPIKVRVGFIGEEIADKEEIAIRSVEWYRYIDPENWGRACYAISALYKMFLYEGKLAAARDLARRASLTQISLAALGMNVQFAEAETGAEDADMDGITRAEEPQSISPSKKRKEQKEHPLARAGTSRELQASKAIVWAQLEQLVFALDAFERWNDIAEEVERSRNDPTAMRAMKKTLRTTLDDVREAMYPLLDKDFMCQALDESEGKFLEQLRKHYLPECILAYNSVLFFAGHAISRSWLVECMNLAQMVATNETLTKAFVEGKRMREFVDCMALSAQGMVEASEVGRRNTKGKKADKEKELGLWNIKWGGIGTGEGVDLEALD